MAGFFPKFSKSAPTDAQALVAEAQQKQAQIQQAQANAQYVAMLQQAQNANVANAPYNPNYTTSNTTTAVYSGLQYPQGTSGMGMGTSIYGGTTGMLQGSPIQQTVWQTVAMPGQTVGSYIQSYVLAIKNLVQSTQRALGIPNDPEDKIEAGEVLTIRCKFRDHAEAHRERLQEMLSANYLQGLLGIRVCWPGSVVVCEYMVGSERSNAAVPPDLIDALLATYEG